MPIIPFNNMGTYMAREWEFKDPDNDFITIYTSSLPLLPIRNIYCPNAR